MSPLKFATCKSGNIRSYAGWIGSRIGGGDAFMIWMWTGGAMRIEDLSSVILTLVTFLPLAGGLLLMLFPRRDRGYSDFCNWYSLLTFAVSLHLPVHFPSWACWFSV